MSSSRVCIVPEYPLSLMTGGTLVQATETCRAMNRCASETGMRFELFEWSQAQAPADCYHFIGLPKYLSGLCSLVARAKRPYVLTLLMGSDQAGSWSAAAWRRRIACWLGRSREHQSAIENASALVAITSIEARAISAIYGVRIERIQLVPVAVNECYFDATPDLWRQRYGAAPFVLSVGAIQQRKNQLVLARICNARRLPLVLVGSVLQGQNAYGERVKVAMAENEKLGGRWLCCDDMLLASAYAACKVFVLLSAGETQPASVLQAMSLRKPVLLADAPYAREHPFNDLPRTDLRTEAEAQSALHAAWAEGVPTRLSSEFTWPRVCGILRSIYSSALSGGPGRI